MQGFFRTIAFGVIVLYLAVALGILTFALIVRRTLSKVKTPVVNSPPERQTIAFSAARAGLVSEQK